MSNTGVFSSLKSALDLDADFFNETPEAFVQGGSRMLLIKDQPLAVMSNVAGVSFMTYVTLRSGYLTEIRMSQRQTRESRRNPGIDGSYLQVSGALSKVALDITVKVDNQVISVTDFVRHILVTDKITKLYTANDPVASPIASTQEKNRAAQLTRNRNELRNKVVELLNTEHNAEITCIEDIDIERVYLDLDELLIPMEEFQATAQKMGYTPWATQPLFFTHNRVPQETWDKVSSYILAHGGEDVTEQRGRTATENTGPVLGAVHLDNDADIAEVLQMEISPADRTKSWYDQGFEDFFEASVTNFNRIVGIRKVWHELKAKLANGLASGELDEAAEKDLSERIATQNNAARAGANSWGGAHQGKSTNDLDPTKIEVQDAWYSTNVPSGRMVLQFKGETEPFSMDLWSPNEGTVAAARPAAIQTIDEDTLIEGSLDTSEDEEEPF